MSEFASRKNTNIIISVVGKAESGKTTFCLNSIFENYIERHNPNIPNNDIKIFYLTGIRNKVSSMDTIQKYAKNYEEDIYNNIINGIEYILEFKNESLPEYFHRCKDIIQEYLHHIHNNSHKMIYIILDIDFKKYYDINDNSLHPAGAISSFLQWYKDTIPVGFGSMLFILNEIYDRSSEFITSMPEPSIIKYNNEMSSMGKTPIYMSEYVIRLDMNIIPNIIYQNKRLSSITLCKSSDSLVGFTVFDDIDIKPGFNWTFDKLISYAKCYTHEIHEKLTKVKETIDKNDD